MKCPKCRASLIQKSDGKNKLRVPILIFNDDGTKCVAPCPRCKEEIDLPIEIQKSALAVDEPKLVLGPQRLTRLR